MEHSLKSVMNLFLFYYYQTAKTCLLAKERLNKDSNNGGYATEIKGKRNNQLTATTAGYENSDIFTVTPLNRNKHCWVPMPGITPELTSAAYSIKTTSSAVVAASSEPADPAPMAEETEPKGFFKY